MDLEDRGKYLMRSGRNPSVVNGLGGQGKYVMMMCSGSNLYIENGLGERRNNA